MSLAHLSEETGFGEGRELYGMKSFKGDRSFLRSVDYLSVLLLDLSKRIRGDSGRLNTRTSGQLSTL